MRHAAESYRGLRWAIFILLGSKCVHKQCKVADARLLTIDHIGGGGSKHRRAQGGGSAYLVTILKDIRAGRRLYRLLCHNHNWLAHLSRRKTQP